VRAIGKVAHRVTSPVNGGAPVTINVPSVGGIYDFIGLNGVRLTDFVNGQSMPSFTSQGGTSQLLNSATISSRAINALGGGIQQLAVRLTVNDGDSTQADFDYNEAFFQFNNVSQVVNTSSVPTYNTRIWSDSIHDSKRPPC
jgi:hypothetical protein